MLAASSHNQLYLSSFLRILNNLIATAPSSSAPSSPVRMVNVAVAAVLVVAGAGLSSASPVLGSAQCSWGPAYWCANIPQVCTH